MGTVWIDRPEQLEDFCEEMGCGPIAVDTESDHFHAYQAQVCLIQVGNAEVSALVDPLALSADELEPLFDLLRDPEVVTLLHAARNDLRELDRDYGVGIANVFDTQVAAKFLGYERNGLSWLQKELVGQTPSGQFQRFDWTRRPVPPAACEYAAADVADLFVLRERFLPELEESGWLEPFYQHCSYIAAVSGYEASPFDEDGWWSVRGRKRLDGRGRAALRELYAARHEICTRENRAALHIFPDEALLALARTRPQEIDGLDAVKRLPHETVHRHGRRIIEAIERSFHAEPPPPKRPRISHPRPPRAQRERFAALKQWRNDTAHQLDLPSALIATNATLSEIASDPPSSVAGLDAFAAILGWHRQMFGEEIMDVLREQA